MAGTPFLYTHRVRYHECDAQGVVFNAHYLTLLDIGLTEILRATVGSITDLNARGYDTMVVDAHLSWKSSARFDDDLVLALWVRRFGNTSMTLAFTQSVGERLCVEGEIVHVWVDPVEHRPVPVPEFARQGFARFAEA